MGRSACADAAQIRDITHRISVFRPLLHPLIVFTGARRSVPGGKRGVLGLVGVTQRAFLRLRLHRSPRRVIQPAQVIIALLSGEVEVLPKLDFLVDGCFRAVQHQEVLPIARAARAAAIGAEPEVAGRTVKLHVLRAPFDIARRDEHGLRGLEREIAVIVHRAGVRPAVSVRRRCVVAELEQIFAVRVEEILRVVRANQQMLVVKARGVVSRLIRPVIRAVGEHHVDIRVRVVVFARIGAECQAVEARVCIAVALLFKALRILPVFNVVAHGVADVGGHVVQQDDAHGVRPIRSRRQCADHFAGVDLDDVALERSANLQRAVNIAVIIGHAARVQRGAHSLDVADDLAGHKIDLAVAGSVGRIEIAHVIVDRRALQVAPAVPLVGPELHRAVTRIKGHVICQISLQQHCFPEIRLHCARGDL